LRRTGRGFGARRQVGCGPKFGGVGGRGAELGRGHTRFGGVGGLFGEVRRQAIGEIVDIVGGQIAEFRAHGDGEFGD